MLLADRSVMIRCLLIPLLLGLQSGAGVRERFQALHAQGDLKGCAELWTASPGLALITIEKDLDEALALRAEAKDTAGAAALEARALWGARVAREALAAPRIAELAASRIGWSDGDRRLFRDARAVHERALGLLDKGQSRLGLEAAQEAVNRSLALGDWHGAARASETCALAHQATSNFEEALVDWEQGRTLDGALRLDDRELACLRGALDMCGATDRSARGREIAEDGIALARRLGDKKAEADFQDRRARFEAKLSK